MLPRVHSPLVPRYAAGAPRFMSGAQQIDHSACDGIVAKVGPLRRPRQKRGK